MKHIELDLERRRKNREYLNAYRAAHPELVRAQRERRRARIMPQAEPSAEAQAEAAQKRERRLANSRVYNEGRAAARPAYYEVYNALRRARRAAAGATPRLPRGMGVIVRA